MRYKNGLNVKHQGKMSSDEDQPLLDHRFLNNNAFNRVLWSRLPKESSYINPTRHHLLRFLTSKAGHYAVLVLVSLDVSCIFADILITLFTCEKTCQSGKEAGKGLENAQEALGIMGLVFSCLFMAVSS